MASDTRERLIDARPGNACATAARPARPPAPSPTAADANLGAITYYFGSKDALLAEAVGGRDRSARRGPPSTRCTTSRSIPRAACSRRSRSCNAAYDRSADDAPVYLEVLIQSRRQPELRGARRPACSPRSGRDLSTLMTELQAQGFLPDWVQPDAMAGCCRGRARRRCCRRRSTRRPVDRGDGRPVRPHLLAARAAVTA